MASVKEKLPRVGDRGITSTIRPSSPPQRAMSLKVIKEEDFDAFLRNYLGTTQEENATVTSFCKLEQMLEMKEEQESDLIKYDNEDTFTSGTFHGKSKLKIYISLNMSVHSVGWQMFEKSNKLFSYPNVQILGT